MVMIYDDLVFYLEGLQQFPCGPLRDWGFGAIDFCFSAGLISRSQYFELLDKYGGVKL